MARNKLAALDKKLLKRELVVTNRTAPGVTKRGTIDLISFSCNDYLGLSQHPEVIRAAKDATELLGAGAGASRHITGNHALYQDLESKLASLKNTEDAVVFGSGYLANIGTIPALVSEPDLIVMDEACHASLHAGVRLARSRIISFSHNDESNVIALLKKHRDKHRYCLLLTEGVFSMDGDRAPISKLLEIATEYDAWLMTDDAHGLGVVGGGRGSNVEANKTIPVPLQMGTLSKSIGTYGGYLCANRTVTNLIRNRARSLIYTTGLPPGTVAAATKALEIIMSDERLVKKPLDNAQLFTEILGLPSAQSAIVPLQIGSSERVLKLSKILQKKGYLVVAIRPPTVPEGTARLRCTFSAAHRKEDVEAFASTLKKTLGA